MIMLTGLPRRDRVAKLARVVGSKLRGRYYRIANGGAVVVLLAALLAARALGFLMNALLVFLLLSTLWLTCTRALALVKQRANWQVYRKPHDHLPQLGAGVVRALALLMSSVAVLFALIPIQFSATELAELKATLYTATVLSVLSALIPRARRWAASDALFGGVLCIASWDLARAHGSPDSDSAAFITSPFAGDAYVVQGGPSLLVNHHAGVRAQAHALDLVLLDKTGRMRESTAESLEAYACFGAPVLAPVDGVVKHVVNDRPDMRLGQLDWDHPGGNSLSIETKPGVYVVLAHLQFGSIEVESEVRVQAGQQVARCGNSGFSSQPHVHVQAQNRAAFRPEDNSVRTYPVGFRAAVRQRRGAVQRAPFFVRRNDVIRPLATTPG